MNEIYFNLLGKKVFCFVVPNICSFLFVFFILCSNAMKFLLVCFYSLFKADYSDNGDNDCNNCSCMCE